MLEKLLLSSLNQAIKEQRMNYIRNILKDIVPDLSDQYVGWNVDNAYIETKVRNMHAFQMTLMKDVIFQFNKPTIMDIGDSSGTHLTYIKKFVKDAKTFSVNISQESVDRIISKKMDAICCRAEEVSKYNINPDIIMSFEMIEHLHDPCTFLHELSTKTSAKYMVITVPYVRTSRVGMRPIRRNELSPMTADDVHVFELCPSDWKLLFKHSGWKVSKERIYLQYPKFHPLVITQPIWNKMDYEGFYGVILERDDTWSKLYKDW